MTDAIRNLELVSNGYQLSNAPELAQAHDGRPLRFDLLARGY